MLSVRRRVNRVLEFYSVFRPQTIHRGQVLRQCRPNVCFVQFLNRRQVRGVCVRFVIRAHGASSEVTDAEARNKKQK